MTPRRECRNWRRYMTALAQIEERVDVAAAAQSTTTVAGECAEREASQKTTLKCDMARRRGKMTMPRSCGAEAGRSSHRD